MFEIKYMVSERDIIDYVKQNDDSLYGYFWFVINDTIVGDPPLDNFPMDFLYENLLGWQSQMIAVATLKEGESKKFCFCTPNRLNLIFRNIDGLKYEIKYLCDDKEVWRIAIDKSLVLGAIEKFNSSFNNGISYVINCRLND